MDEGPGQLNRAASAAYQQLTPSERVKLKQQAKGMQPQERKMTRKDVMKRSDKIFAKIQKLVWCIQLSLHCLSRGGRTRLRSQLIIKYCMNMCKVMLTMKKSSKFKSVVT